MNLCENKSEAKTHSKYENSYVWLAGNRIIFLKEDVTKEVAADMTALLLYYDSVDPGKEITIYIHCRGGDADGLVQIYDVMQILDSPIKTVCIGRAASAASIILAAGAKGRRYAMKNSSIMLHGVQVAFPIPGDDQTSSKNYFQFIKSINDVIMKMLAKHTGNTLDKVKEDCLRDLYLNASQAKKYGIIDHII